MLRQQRRFLEAFRQHGNITRACDETAVRDARGQVLEPGPERHTVARWAAADAEFAAALANAREEAADYAEYELWRRGVEGVEKPVYYQGVVVGAYREYSDQLLLAQVRKLRPAEWREQQAVDVRARVQADVGMTVTHQEAVRAHLSDADVDRLTSALIGIGVDLGDGASPAPPGTAVSADPGRLRGDWSPGASAAGPWTAWRPDAAGLARLRRWRRPRRLWLAHDLADPAVSDDALASGLTALARAGRPPSPW